MPPSGELSCWIARCGVLTPPTVRLLGVLSCVIFCRGDGELNGLCSAQDANQCHDVRELILSSIRIEHTIRFASAFSTLES